jgi:hypothetical protein
MLAAEKSAEILAQVQRKGRDAGFIALDCEKPIEKELFSELLKRGIVS